MLARIFWSRSIDLTCILVPSQAPILSTPVASNGTYIAIAVDTTANLSSTIPAELLWFQQDLAFSPAGIASSRSIAQVPYLAPANVGHGYLILLYAQPPGFIVPPDFPYTGKFRSNFNVSRVAVDFKAPPLEANWFILGSNCTKEEARPTGTSTVGTAYATGTAGYYGRNGPFPRPGFHLRD